MRDKINKIYRKWSAGVRKSADTKPRMNKNNNHLFIYQKRGTSVHESVNTKLRKIKNIILIYQKRSASVRKSVDTKPRMDNNIIIIIRKGVRVCASP